MLFIWIANAALAVGLPRHNRLIPISCLGAPALPSVASPNAKRPAFGATASSFLAQCSIFARPDPAGGATPAALRIGWACPVVQARSESGFRSPNPFLPPPHTRRRRAETPAGTSPGMSPWSRPAATGPATSTSARVCCRRRQSRTSFSSFSLRSSWRATTFTSASSAFVMSGCGRIRMS